MSSNEKIPQYDDFSRQPEQEVFARLQALGIEHQTRLHPPTHRVADDRQSRPGQTKSLFLKDAKGSPFLITAKASEARLPLNTLRKTLKADGRLSFAEPELMWKLLKVTPGSVTPLALLHDREQQICFAMQSALTAEARIDSHPLRNDMTTSLAIADFSRFIDSCGHQMLCF